MKLKNWITFGGLLAAFGLPLSLPAQSENDQADRELEQMEEERAELERALEEMRRELEAAREEAREAAREAREAAREAAEDAREAAREAAQEAGRGGAFSWIWNRDEDERPSRMPDPENYFGVTIESVPRALRSYIDLEEGVGILFTAVHTDSPAEKAGIKKDDILVSFAGQTIFNYDQFSKLIDLQKAGEPVSVRVLRKGSMVDLKIELEERIRRHGQWIVPPPPGVPEPPAPPAPPAPTNPVGQLQWHGEGENFEAIAGEVMGAIGEFLPGNVSVFIDDERNVQVDLRGLTENLQDLESRLEQLELQGDSMNWDALVDLYREAKGRRSVVMLGQTQMSLSTNEGKVRLFVEEGQRHAIVTSNDGRVLFDGPLPEDYEVELDPVATKLIKALLEARGDLETDLSEEPEVEILEIDESEKLSKA
jgi:hypothetical protein